MKVILAPVLRAEKWTSIDLLHANYLATLPQFRDEVELVDFQPDESLAGSRIGKRLVRDVLYPMQIRRTAKQTSPRPVLHVIDHSYGHLCAAWQPSVITCNDLNHFTAPALTGLTLKLWRIRVNQMRKAARVVCISGQLASEVQEHVGIPSERIIIAHYGIDNACFRPLPLEEAAAKLPQLAAERERSLLVLNIGSNLSRKNLPTVLRAIALLRARGLPVKLVKIGHNLVADGLAPLIRELKLDDAIIDLGKISPDQVAAACNLCHALHFPSMYEGFGRPTIEAQATGLPCVLAEASCMHEVGGQGALYHAPTDVEAAAAHLQSAMTDSSTRELLIAAGFENVKRFSWANHASQLIRAWKEAAADS
jgi:glycosyltransferase involved in cell wall biosynthesis